MQENQRSKLYLQNLPGFFASFRRHFVQIVRRKPSSPLRKILYRRFWSELAISRKITIFLCSDRSGGNCFHAFGGRFASISHKIRRLAKFLFDLGVLTKNSTFGKVCHCCFIRSRRFHEKICIIFELFFLYEDDFKEFSTFGKIYLSSFFSRKNPFLSFAINLWEVR